MESLRFWRTPANKPRFTACRQCWFLLSISVFFLIAIPLSTSLSASLSLSVFFSFDLFFLFSPFFFDRSLRPIEPVKFVVHRYRSVGRLFSERGCCCRNPRVEDKLHNLKLPGGKVKYDIYRASQIRVEIGINQILYQLRNVQLEAFANRWSSKRRVTGAKINKFKNFLVITLG